MSTPDTSAGFRYRGRIFGDASNPHKQKITAQDTATYYKGDIVNVESGEIDLGATGDTALIGPVIETVSATDSTTTVEVYTDPDVILGVYDANARLKGATLDLSGSHGAMTVSGSSNKEFVVWADSAADEETLVVFNHGAHLYNTAQ